MKPLWLLASRAGILSDDNTSGTDGCSMVGFVQLLAKLELLTSHKTTVQKSSSFHTCQLQLHG